MTEGIIPYDTGHNEHQGDDAWRQERSGCITASKMTDLLWNPGEVYKTGDRKGEVKQPPEMRKKYIDQIVAEILTGRPVDQVNTRTLDYGKEMEPFAVAAYEERTGRLVEQCGFVRHRQYPFIGASPDFLIDGDGGGEIKCPASITVHATTLREGLPDEHVSQIQGGLWVTGRLWWDFVSFHPSFPKHLQLYVQRVHRDNTFIERLKRDCLSAWDEVQTLLARFEMREAA